MAERAKGSSLRLHRHPTFRFAVVAERPQKEGTMMDAFFRLDMKAATQVGGCPVCAIIAQRTDRYLRFFLTENVLDPYIRLRLIASQGFCNLHAHWLARLAPKLDEALGVATVYEHLVSEWRRQLQRASEETSPQKIAQILRPQRRCPVCEHADTWERDCLSALLRALTDPQSRNEAQRLYEATGGLCLPHLRRALQLADDSEVVTYLLQDACRRWEALERDIAEFCRKHDYRFRNEPMRDEERQSWRRAIEAFVGKEGMHRQNDLDNSLRRGLRRWLKLG
jgi:hypothetical protein